MTGRQPLQSTANLPVKPASQQRPGEGFTKPAGLPGRPQPHTSAARPQPHTSGSSKPQPPMARPGLMSSAGASRAPASAYGGKPTKPGGPPTSSAIRPQPVKPETKSSSLGATATFGKSGGDKQHRWKLDDFDIGRPLGKVIIAEKDQRLCSD